MWAILPTDPRLPRALPAGLADPQAAGDPAWAGRTSPGGTFVLWNAKPENRHLPSVWEWANIRLLTTRKNWTGPQKKMMRTAGRVHGVRIVLALLLFLCVVLGGSAVRRRVIEDLNANHAAGLVEEVLKANTSQVPGIVDSMRGYRRWVDPALKEALANTSEGSPEKLHAGLALLPVDNGQAGYLYQRLLEATPGDLAVICKALQKDHQAALTAKLWSVMDTAQPEDRRLLPPPPPWPSSTVMARAGPGQGTQWPVRWSGSTRSSWGVDRGPAPGPGQADTALGGDLP